MRLAGKMKLGFYPALPEIVLGVLAHLQFDEPTTILDPCCGEGAVLAQILDGSPSRFGFGIELDTNRATIAQNRLAEHQVLNVSYEETRIPEKAYSLLWLNPPYDTELGGGNRQEFQFLQNLTECLVPDGVLVFLIPGTVLSSVINLLSRTFVTVKVYRGDPQWKQVVILAQKGKPTWMEEDQCYSRLAEIGEIYRRNSQTSSIPDILERPESIRVVPRADPADAGLKSAQVDYDQLENSILNSKWNRSLEASLCVTQRNRKIKPVTPLRSTHLANILLLGGINGQVGFGDEAHVVYGSVKKKEESRIEIDAVGMEIETRFEIPQTFLSIAELATGMVYDLED